MSDTPPQPDDLARQSAYFQARLDELTGQAIKADAVISRSTRELKQHPATRHIPVLALTAHAFEDARQQAEAAGCDGFVTKPCLPDQLVARVRAVLGAPAIPPKKR